MQGAPRDWSAAPLRQPRSAGAQRSPALVRRLDRLLPSGQGGQCSFFLAFAALYGNRTVGGKREALQAALMENITKSGLPCRPKRSVYDVERRIGMLRFTILWS